MIVTSRKLQVKSNRSSTSSLALRKLKFHHLKFSTVNTDGVAGYDEGLVCQPEADADAALAECRSFENKKF